jgi:hypothetical protein
MEKLAVLVAEIRERLAGRKTYLLAGLLVLTVVVLVFFGKLTPETALAVALVFAGLISASFRSAIEQHHAEVVNLLIDVAEVGVAVRSHNKAAEVSAAEGLAEQGIAVAASAGLLEPQAVGTKQAGGTI